jgi:hypothetical protein
MSEAQWQALIMQFAKLHGWWAMHPYDSRRTERGWPDLVLIRPPEFVLVELKTDKGRVSPEQRHVLDMLDGCGVEAWIWRPKDERDAFARLARKTTSVLDATAQHR